jgi:hypothetical protein
LYDGRAPRGPTMMPPHEARPSSLVCTGTGVDVLGELNSDEGGFTVSVTNVASGAIVDQKTASALGTTRLAQQVLYSVGGLAKDSYAVKLQKQTSDASYLVIDAFAVIPDVIAPVHDVAFRGLTFAHSTWLAPSQSGYVDNQAGVLWDPATHLPTHPRRGQRPPRPAHRALGQPLRAPRRRRRRARRRHARLPRRR